MRCSILIFLICASLGCSSGDPAEQATEGAASNHIYLEQNWSAKQRQEFYFLSQGSYLLPYDIFLHLEQVGSTDLFRSDANLSRLGFLPIASSRNNPDGLPIGFTRSQDHVGPSCAACHTQLITYKGRSIYIDGGQSQIDLQAFLREMRDALAATLNDQKKFQRLQTALDAELLPTENLHQQLQAEYDSWHDYLRRNHTEVDYGYTRLDAFGAILNKGLFLTGVKDNFNSPNAPTSFPYIWDTPHHDYVEWNGSQSNSSAGALARNIGETLGVYGRIETQQTKQFLFFDGGYESSIETRNLRKAERLISELHSPLWPDFFPPIDQGKAEKGREIYEQYCLSCHEDINRVDPKRKIKVRMSTLDYIQTDPLMATNAINLKGKTGKLKGKRRFYFKGKVMAEEEPALHVVNHFMVGLLKNNPLQSYLAIRDTKKLGHGEELHPRKYVDGELIEAGQEVSKKALLAYKARPLNGIWTAAPYLHNGSVINLYELLLPAEERSKTFNIGDWEYDPKHLGYVNQAKENSFVIDTRLKGNSNVGHEYGSGGDGKPRLSDEQIWALLEYLKTL